MSLYPRIEDVAIAFDIDPSHGTRVPLFNALSRYVAFMGIWHWFWFGRIRLSGSVGRHSCSILLEHGMPLRSAPTYHPLAIEPFPPPPRFVKYLPASNRQVYVPPVTALTLLTVHRDQSIAWEISVSVSDARGEIIAEGVGKFGRTRIGLASQEIEGGRVYFNIYYRVKRFKREI